jgi:TP901 family phage tail tape measure protein
MAVALGASVKAAVDWESAWAGVTKTTDGTTSEMAALEDGLRDLAKELPATHGEIAAVAEAAGALGIQREAIEGFTKTMIDLGETTDLTADQAATSFARIANVMGTSQSDFDRMGSTIVALGNNGASTESEIAELAQRLSAAGAIADLSEADVFAFAETLSAVGVEAEAGGTALSKVFTSIRDAVLDGSDKLDVFAETAGMSVDEFSTAFREDAAGAITSFIEGLGGISSAGQSTTAVFKELELRSCSTPTGRRSTRCSRCSAPSKRTVMRSAQKQRPGPRVPRRLPKRPKLPPRRSRIFVTPAARRTTPKGSPPRRNV